MSPMHHTGGLIHQEYSSAPFVSSENEKESQAFMPQLASHSQNDSSPRYGVVRTSTSSVRRAVSTAVSSRLFLVAALVVASASLLLYLKIPSAFSTRGPSAPQMATNANASSSIKATVAYRSLSLDMKNFAISVPVAMWYPIYESEDSIAELEPVTYDHRISVKKIAGLLAGLNFIPGFVSRSFQLSPSLPFGSVVDGSKVTPPSPALVVVLAHGFLGSRFDLSHVGESLAQQGTRVETFSFIHKSLLDDLFLVCSYFSILQDSSVSARNTQNHWRRRIHKSKVLTVPRLTMQSWKSWDRTSGVFRQSHLEWLATR